LSHHVFIANSQHRVYFTYNGGPVFNLAKSAAPAAVADSQDIESLDAPALARRGAAFAGRRDFEHAIADFTHAAELDPNNAEYPYRRGAAYLLNNKPLLASTDFDHALELDPDYLPALVSRAQLRIQHKDSPAAVTDLDAADRTAAKQADVRFTLAQLYREAGLLGRSITQYDLWIANHPDDAKMGDALRGRCWTRALQGQDLAQALTDCNNAVRRSLKSSASAAAAFDSRALVRLRMGDYDKSIADYDDSLRIAPKDPWSLYGRGVAKLRKHRAPEGEADMAAAVSIWPQIAEEFSRRGITP
jgi:tetratricopeptide (TPR) repeat protein